ncbi:bacteriohemerythrin [Geothrix sp. 21YS21S-2]|uniref:bacteriohemerythrin n=1 Tax=Geothrix sp. 21YS21S-2 TaxID=3068893 RepID=UPI0027B8C232|nr:bacteriohemerythrin [Geothrix sp. 21YS21S-2]
MALIAWHDRFATGIPSVDDQHKTLFQTVNDFHEGLVTGRGREELARTLDFLVTYTVRHFKTEEDFMELHRFDGLKAHRSEHQLLLEEVAAFKEQWSRNAAAVRPMEVARFLGDWLTHHIQQMDFQYARFLKEGGLSV